MGWFSSVCSFVSSVASGISSAISSIGSAIGSGLSAVVGGIATAIERGAGWLGGVVGNFAKGILDALHITRPEEQVEDFGERVLQGAERGIKLESSQDFEDYLSKLRSFELDPDKSERRMQSEKLAAAMSVGTVAVERRFDLPQDMAAQVWLLPLVNRELFTPERVTQWLAARQVGQLLFDYLEGKLSPDAGVDLAKQLHGMEQRLNPAADLQELRQRLQGARHEFQALQQDFDNALKRLNPEATQP